MSKRVYTKNEKEYTCFCYNVCSAIVFNYEFRENYIDNQQNEKIQGTPGYIYFILNPIVIYSYSLLIGKFNFITKVKTITTE